FRNVEKRGKGEYECRKMGKICEKKMNELFGRKEILEEDGGRGVRNWVREEEDVLISDSRFRDGEECLVGRGVRRKDMMKIGCKSGEVFKDSF
ncbi:hypothetical protein, partial [Staphylococcus epidermidis]|uniref:hypothetical protein n=1 Tax=Staphylococcus epidermidis TaxID=1282 RepID=UPI001C930F8F